MNGNRIAICGTCARYGADLGLCWYRNKKRSPKTEACQDYEED